MVRDVIGTVVRFGLAAVWLISGALKAIHPEQTYLAVNAYDVLPSSSVSLVAGALPFVELALGSLLLIGFGVRPAAASSSILLLAFIAGVGQAWARGLSIDCGCFGGGGPVDPSQTKYPQEIARDAAFLALAVCLLIRPRTLFAVDALLGRRQPMIMDDEQPVVAEPEQPMTADGARPTVAGGEQPLTAGERPVAERGRLAAVEDGG